MHTKLKILLLGAFALPLCVQAAAIQNIDPGDVLSAGTPKINANFSALNTEIGNVPQLSGNWTIGGTYTFTVAPVFTDAPNTRVALGLQSAATQPSSAFDSAGLANAVQTNLTSEITRAQGVEATKAPITTTTINLPNVTMSGGGGTLGIGLTNNVAGGSYYSPPLPSTLSTPPARFAIKAPASGSTTTLTYPTETGASKTITLLFGEVITFQQKNTSGWGAESGNKPLDQLSALFDAAGLANQAQTTAEAFSVNRANHTGTQPFNTLSGVAAPSQLGSGTPTNSTYLRGDGSWASAMSGSGSIASTGNLLMGDSAGNAAAVVNATDLYRVLKTRRETASVPETPPINLLSQAYSYNSSTTLPTGTIVIPANSYGQWYLPGQGSTYAGQTLYSYAVAVGDAPYGALLLDPIPGGSSFSGTNSTLAPGVYHSVSVLPSGNGDLYFRVYNVSNADITVYAPVMATTDTGLAALSSYADLTTVASQPIADFDFTKFSASDRTNRRLGEKQTTKAFDTNLGNDNAAGTLYAPFRTLSRFSIVNGDTVGIYRGNLLRDSLSSSLSTIGTTQGIYIQDLAFGSPKPMPIISAFDAVTQSSLTSNGDNTYSYLWTPADSTITNDGYSNVYVVEIDTTAEPTTPIAARHRMTQVANQSACSSTADTYYVLPPGTGSGQSGSATQWKATIHAINNLNPTSDTTHRYEVISRVQPANWGTSNLGDGVMSGIEMMGGSSGYGCLSGPVGFVGDRLMFLHGSTHQAVIGGGTLQRSLFYGMGVHGSFDSGSGDCIQLTYYTPTATGISWSINNCLFYPMANGENVPPYCLISHSGGTNFDRGDIADCAFVANRLYDGSLQGTAIDCQALNNGVVNRVYVQGFSYPLGNNMPATGEVKNSVFRQTYNTRITSKYHDNIVESQTASLAQDNTYPNANLFQFWGNGATIINNIFWAHGLANATNATGAYGFSVSSGITTGTSNHNILIVDPAPGAQGSYYTGTIPSGITVDYNLVISTANGGISSSGSNGNQTTWAGFLAGHPGIDTHSMFVDLSSDPRGIKAVFADPANGDWRWAQTDVARRCAAFCKANNVGPATVISRWPVVPTVDEAARLLNDL